ncbi:GABA permease (4-amino butyrate transport carrier) [Priestia megaterium]|uniref:GABA permease (4-amino butyrate transport carrier) n=1 Tax=Priestia megaterium TaxID=1404 RepID=A0AA86I302_PRIMG|nr:amino acid permease [Priestia megaterium]AXI27861.1 GABA permease (4-amino butyrate transport carrier) [Priestia megaterium]
MIENNIPSQKLKKQLLPRHIRMIAIGGTVGTGIFKGSADTVGLAGPGVIFSYIFAGLLLMIVMGALIEMAITHPSHNMKDLIEKALGKRFSFIVGSTYCFMWLTVCVIEVIAAGSFLQYWFASIPLWILCLLCSVVLILINANSVKSFGEIEFWFAGIKIFVIIAFIIVGAAILIRLVPSEGSDSYMQNYTDFFPNGWTGVFSTLLVVIFSYGGSELIGLTITETKNAEKVLPGVVKGVMWRVMLFYTLPILIICGLIPWDKIDVNASPFVQVFEIVGIQGASHVMNFILLTAVLSAANSGIYGCTRTLFSLSKSGDIPKYLSYVNRKGVPIYSLLFSVIFLLLGTYIVYLYPDKAFNYLLAIPGFTVSIIWISICLAQLKLRRTYKQEPYFKLWFYPYLTIFSIIVLATSFIVFLIRPDNRPSSVVCVIFVSLVTIYSFFKGQRKIKLSKKIFNLERKV